MKISNRVQDRFRFHHHRLDLRAKIGGYGQGIKHQDHHGHAHDPGGCDPWQPWGCECQIIRPDQDDRQKCGKQEFQRLDRNTIGFGQGPDQQKCQQYQRGQERHDDKPPDQHEGGHVKEHEAEQHRHQFFGMAFEKRRARIAAENRHRRGIPVAGKSQCQIYRLQHSTHSSSGPETYPKINYKMSKRFMQGQAHL